MSSNPQARRAFSRQYQRRTQWLMYSVNGTVSFLLGMELLVVSDNRDGMLVDAATRTLTLWLGIGLGTLLVSTLAPKISATHAVGGGAMLLATAMCPWNLVGWRSLVLCLSIGCALGVTSTGSHLLARRVQAAPSAFPAWLGLVLGGGIGAASHSWAIVIAVPIALGLCIAGMAWRLPDPQRGRRISQPWQARWFPTRPILPRVLPMLRMGMPGAAVTLLGLTVPANSPLVIVASLTALWFGAWCASLRWTRAPWWDGGMYLVAALGWLCAALPMPAIAGLGAIGTLFCLGRAHRPPPATDQPGIVLPILIPLLAGGVPWLIYRATPATMHYPLFAIALMIAGGILLSLPPPSPSAVSTSPRPPKTM